MEEIVKSAVKENKLLIMEFLIVKGFDINQSLDSFGNTALSIAFCQNNISIEMIELFLKHGANIRLPILTGDGTDNNPELPNYSGDIIKNETCKDLISFLVIVNTDRVTTYPLKKFNYLLAALELQIKLLESSCENESILEDISLMICKAKEIESLELDEM